MTIETGADPDEPTIKTLLSLLCRTLRWTERLCLFLRMAYGKGVWEGGVAPKAYIYLRRCVRRPSINVLCYCVPQYEYLKPHPIVNPELVSRT